MSGLTHTPSDLNSTSVPQVSVILCGGCQPAQWARALSSLHHQTCRNFEVFAIVPRPTSAPSASTMEAPSVIPVGISLHSIPWTNWSVSRNAAIRASRAPFIAFLDANDFWAPTFLERCLDFFVHHPECDVVSSRTALITPHQEASVVIPAQVPEGWILNRLFSDPCLTNSCAVIRRQVWERVGGLDEEVPLRSLEHFWLRAAVANRFGALSEPLVMSDWPVDSASPDEQARQAFNRAELLHRFYTEQGGDQRVDNDHARKILHDCCLRAARWAARVGDLAYCARLYRGTVYYSPTFWNKLRFLSADRRRLRAGLPSLEESRFVPDDVT